MVRFTSGDTVPLAVTSVGSGRVSAFAVLNNSGWSVSKRFGSRVTGGLPVAAGVSLEQPRPAARAMSNRTRGIQAAAGEAAWLRVRHGMGGTVVSVPRRRAETGSQRVSKVKISQTAFLIE